MSFAAFGDIMFIKYCQIGKKMNIGPIFIKYIWKYTNLCILLYIFLLFNRGEC